MALTTASHLPPPRDGAIKGATKGAYVQGIPLRKLDGTVTTTQQGLILWRKGTIFGE
jgi:hypothetical protein